MAITFVNSSSASVAGGVALSLSMPAGLQQDDVVYVLTGRDVQTTALAITSTGWTQLADVSNGSGNMAIWRKVMGASPDTQIDWSTPQNAKAGCAMAFRGVDTTTPEDATTTTTTGASGAPDSPSITTVTDHAFTISFGVSQVNDAAITNPTGYSNQVVKGQAGAVTVCGSTKDVSPAAAEDPSAWTNFTSGTWLAATIAIRPATAAATTNFGWYEQIGRAPAPPPSLPNYNSYTRDLRPGINFTTPTPTNLEWFVPYAKLPPVVPRPWLAIAWAPNAPAIPNIGWFEPYARLPIAGKAPALSSFAMAPVTITPPPFGWFEPYSKAPTIAKPPASSIAMDPQAIAPAQTLTTDIGWFSPYAKPGAPPPKGVSSIAMDPQPIGAPQTLTTDIGWFTPYTVLPKSAWTPPRNSFAWTSLAITAPPFGWFEAYARRAPIGPVARGSVAAPPPPVVTLNIGWFEPYARLPATLLRPYSSIVLPPLVTVAPVPPVVPVPTGGGWKEIPRPSFDNTVKVHWAPIEVYAWTAFVVEPVFITAPRWPEKPVQAILPKPAPTPAAPAPIASPEKPLPPPETVLAGWVAASVAATVAFRGAIVDMRPVAAAKRRKMAAYAEAAQEHDRKLIREWLEARGVKL